VQSSVFTTILDSFQYVSTCLIFPNLLSNISNFDFTMATKLKEKPQKAAGAVPRIVDPDAWKPFSNHKVPFLAIPPEIHLKILPYLNPIDTICLSLVKLVISLISTPPYLFKEIHLTAYLVNTSTPPPQTSPTYPCILALPTPATQFPTHKAVGTAHRSSTIPHTASYTIIYVPSSPST
jgi:hypothetical protein